MTAPILVPSRCCNSAFAVCVTQNISRCILSVIIFLRKKSWLFTRPLVRILSLLAFLPASLLLHAQSFEQLEGLLELHPQLQTLSYQATSTKELSEAAMGLPDPVISLGINNFPIFDPSFNEYLPTNKAIGVQQRFPSRAIRQARLAIGQAQARQFDQKREQLFSAMRSELIALLYKKTRIKSQAVLAKQRDVKYDQLIDALESAVQGGRPSVFRLAEIETERVEVGRTLIDLDSQSAQVDARLIYLLGHIPLTSPPALNTDRWSGDSMDFHASQVAEASVRVSDGGVDQAKSLWKPEWGAQLKYQQRDVGNDFAGDDWASMMVTVTVPFWAKKKQEPRLRAAEARRAAAQARLKDAMRQASAQYTYFKAIHTASYRAEMILRQKIEAINDEIAAQRVNYESGAGDYTAVIDGEIAVLKLRAEIAEEQALSGITAAQMDALLVTP